MRTLNLLFGFALALEDRLRRVMAVSGADHVHVEVELAAERGGLPELLDEGERKIARDEEEFLVDRGLEDDVGPAREVDDRAREGPAAVAVPSSCRSKLMTLLSGVA